MKKDLKLNSIHLNQIGNNVSDCWIYEEPNGIHIYAKVCNSNERIALLPLATIRAYIKRLDDKKK